MVEGFIEWAEQVNELTNEMQLLIGDLYGFMADAKMFGVIIGVVVGLLFVFVIAEHRNIRRLEEKIDLLIGSQVDEVEGD